MTDDRLNTATKDGSLVEIYRRMSGTAEVETIAAWLKPNSTVLDLGAGAGRIANPLAELGHQVTAVDDSADMLAHVRCARTVQARIEDVRLPERFDAVLLMSSLVNYPGTQLRRGVVATVAHHLKLTGKALIQWSSPSWFAQRPPGRYRRMDGQTMQTMAIHTSDGEFVIGEFTLDFDGMSLTQPLCVQRVSVDELRSVLEHAGLRLNTPDPESARWLEASPQR
ncbi:Cypemycin methyltransferase [Mycobacterium basiliense]|uniref:Cypemycin methyltransferase n=1 Tax=Mycobacterium basiliense TaxID=2094119 RepID=A0A3S4CSD2_9MYCO|nr:class I SAM-dependent methyltransferase [Mycobacterium basiliense]VDM86790.1 Cypemycin methyltransferase [Mycobacterium basiliense]